MTSPVWTFSLPSGFHLMALYTAGLPVTDDSSQWRAYVRQNPFGQFRGGTGRTPQEAIDNAHAVLAATLAVTVEPTYNEPRITINLQNLLGRP